MSPSTMCNSTVHYNIEFHHIFYCSCASVMSPARYKYGKHPPSRFQIRESMYTATELLVYNALLGTVPI